MTETIAVICTANQCRSPAGEGFLRRQAINHGAEATIVSAGFLDGGMPSPPEVTAAAERLGLDITDHVSRQIDRALIDDADLIITMTRRHLRDIAVDFNGSWPKTFTLRELVRRASDVGARGDGVPIDEWVALVHAGRTPADLVGEDPDDDVEDPTGGTEGEFNEMAETVYGLMHQLADILWATI